MNRKTESNNIKNNNNFRYRFYYIAAAATTALAGIIHLSVAANAISHHVFTNTITLFIIGGVAQVFWILPILKRWGRVWYSIGIAGTAVFIALWAITRMPANPIIHKAADVGKIDIATELAEFAFIGFSFVILAIENRRIKKEVV
jgi:hypothetical protein